MPDSLAIALRVCRRVQPGRSAWALNPGGGRARLLSSKTAADSPTTSEKRPTSPSGHREIQSVGLAAAVDFLTVAARNFHPGVRANHPFSGTGKHIWSSHQEAN